jgi:hypothetical protein
MHHLMGHADAYGTLLVSPQSRGSTWDMLRGGFGPGALVARWHHQGAQKD